MDKNERIIKGLIKIGAISFILLGLYELNLLRGLDGYNSKKIPMILIIFGGSWTLAGIFLLIKKPLNFINFILSFTTFNILYLILELYVFFNIHYGYKSQFFLVNKSFTCYNEIRGYKYTQPVRLISITNRKVEFDKKFVPNKQGFSSNKDYVLKKTDSSVYRIMVLGDSFSDGCFLDLPWEDRSEALLKAKGKKIEIYSFSYSGNGITNWHSIFTKEIEPNYEYDCIIIANFIDDLARKFNIQLQSKTSRYGNFDSIPKGELDFEKNYLPKMTDLTSTPKYKYELIYSENQLDQKEKDVLSKPPLIDINGNIKKPEPYILYFIINNLIGPLYFKENTIANMTYDNVMEKYGKHRINLLENIVQICKQKKKRVILASIPFKSYALSQKNGSVNDHQEECKLISEKLGIEYVDGYTPFIQVDTRHKKEYWFTYDGHWNSKGSDLFAEYISQYLIK